MPDRARTTTSPSTTAPRRAGGLLAVAALAAALAACSDSPTKVLVWISRGDSLPQIRVLRAGLTDAVADASAGARPCFDVVDVPNFSDGGLLPPSWSLIDTPVTVPRGLTGHRWLAVDGYSGVGDDTGCRDGVRTVPVVSGSSVFDVMAGSQAGGGTIDLQLGACGDHVVDGVGDPPLETCDDGNRQAGDGCDPTCHVEGGAPGDAGPNDDGASGDDASTAVDAATD